MGDNAGMGDWTAKYGIYTKSDYVQFNIENNIRQAQHTVQCEHDMYAAMHFI